MAIIAGAGVAAIAAYLDGKYHLRKDAADLLEKRSLRAHTERLCTQNLYHVLQRHVFWLTMHLIAVRLDRLSPWYDFEQQAARLGDEECLWYRAEIARPSVTYTWRETYQNCCRMAQFLRRHGVRRGDLVGTYLINSPEFVFNMAGSWAIGAAPALINYNLSGDALVHCLKISESKVLLVEDDEGCRSRIEQVRTHLESELGIRVIVLDAPEKARIRSLEATRPVDGHRAHLAGNAPVFLFYTSGTTGHPKACAFPMAAVRVLGHPKLRTCNLKSGPNADTWYDCMPMYHGTGGTTVIGALISGTRLAIGRRFSVTNFWRDVHDSEANAFIYVGETARYLLAAPPSSLDRDHKLKAMYGNGMRPDVWRKFVERFNIPIVNEFFNSTEGMLSMLNVCKNSFHDAAVGHHGGLQRYLNRNVIVPVEPNHEDGDKLLRDPKTGFASRRSYEEGGEILIRCITGKEFVGYHNNSVATERKFERNVFRNGDLWYRTGDALRRDSDGRWFFLDRLGDTFRWKSENVSSQEVAEVLGRFPKLEEANVYGVEIPHHDGRVGCVAMYILPEERQNFDYRGLLQHARKGLPKYAVPVFIRLVEAQAPMHNNKQTKVPLRKEGINPRNVREGQAGRGDTLLWVPPDGDTYVPFGDKDWEDLNFERSRL